MKTNKSLVENYDFSKHQRLDRRGRIKFKSEEKILNDFLREAQFESSELIWKHLKEEWIEVAQAMIDMGMISNKGLEKVMTLKMFDKHISLVDRYPRKKKRGCK